MPQLPSAVPVFLLVVGLLLDARPAAAQADPTPPAGTTDRKKDAATFLAGAGLAFVIHEAGHFTFDEIFDAQPRLRAVHFGPIPFFAISPRRPLSPRQLFIVSSAGFWTQELTTELLMLHDTSLRRAHAPLVKGMLAFDILTSIGYAAVAFARAGPAERDTRGMATGLDVPEPIIGALVLAPAALEGYRCFRPHSTWARWTTRAIGVGSAVLIFAASPDRRP